MFHLIEVLGLLLILALYFEIFDDKTVYWVLQTIEKIVADAESHWIGHSEAFKEVKVELLPFVTLFIIITLMMDLNFIRQRILNTFLSHAIRPKKCRLRNPTFLLAQRQCTLQQLVIFQQKFIVNLIIVRILLINIIHFDSRMQANQRIRFYSIMLERFFIFENTALKNKQLVLWNNPQQFMNALLQVQNFLTRGRFDDVLFSIPKYTDIHSSWTPASLVNLLNMQDRVLGQSQRFYCLGIILYMFSFEENAIGVGQLDLLIVDEIDELVKGLPFLQIYGTSVAVIQSDKDLDVLLGQVIWHFGSSKKIIMLLLQSGKQSSSVKAKGIIYGEKFGEYSIKNMDFHLFLKC